MWPQCNQNIYSDTIPKINYDSILEWNILCRNSTFKPKQCERKYVCQDTRSQIFVVANQSMKKLIFYLIQKCNLSLNGESLMFETIVKTVSGKIKFICHLMFLTFTWAYPVTLYACPVTNPFDNLLLCPCVILVCIKTKF